MRPLAPIEQAAAEEIASGVPTSALFEELDQLRCTAARSVHPIDQLDSISAEEWLLLAALNNLLQSTNPSLLGSFGGASKADALRERTREMIGRAGSPRTLAQVLSRHALFSRAALLTRHDTDVSWWSGKQSFVGRLPPARLLAWPKLRRVSRRTHLVELTAMGPEAFRQTLQYWLSATPLTAFARLDRTSARFCWTGSALSLTKLALGRRWALNLVLASQDVSAALDELARAAAKLEPESSKAFRHARGFIEEAVLWQRQLGRIR